MWRYAGMANRIVTIRWPAPSAWVVVASEDAVAGGARWTVAAAVAVFPLSAHAQFDPTEKTIAELQGAMASGQVTSVQLVSFYVSRIQQIDQSNNGPNSVIELNPDALNIAANADAMRSKGKVLGPLHGIPVLLKDNIDTGDKMQTTAGSFALAGKPALKDSTVAAKLRAGGAVILGKTNLSEWANFRSFFSTSGWSGRGGLTHNPYSLDRNACGSSSGSAAAAAARRPTAASFVLPTSIAWWASSPPSASPAEGAWFPSHTLRTPSGRTRAQ